MTEMSHFVKYHTVNPVIAEYNEHRWQIYDVVVSALAKHIFRQSLDYYSPAFKPLFIEPVSDTLRQNFFGLSGDMIAESDTEPFLNSTILKVGRCRVDYVDFREVGDYDNNRAPVDNILARGTQISTLLLNYGAVYLMPRHSYMGGVESKRRIDYELRLFHAFHLRSSSESKALLLELICSP